MKQALIKVLEHLIVSMGITDVTPQVEIPDDLSHGDYSSNVAMILAKRLKKSPLVIAQEIKEKLQATGYGQQAKIPNLNTVQSCQKQSPHGNYFAVLQDIEKIEVASPGFINFWLALPSLNRYLSGVLTTAYSVKRTADSDEIESTEVKNILPATSNKLPAQKIMVEFAHPNTHKAFHIGHLRNISTGESIVRLLEAVGHKVIRVNYQGDVGMHIAKCLYGILQAFSAQGKALNFLDENESKTPEEKVELLGKAYAAGSKAFEEDERAKATIKDYNFLIYASAQRFNKERGLTPSSTDYLKFIKSRKDVVDQIFKLWKNTRQWSLDYFATIYKRLGTTYERLYFESECLNGVDIAQESVKKGILSKSEGAIIFNGKPFALDTRVFVNSLGLPTYEAKELALSQIEFSEFGKLDRIIHVVGPEQASFFQVTFKVEELLGIQKNQQLHLVYGWVKLKHGKMSSRSGNVVLGEWLIEEAKKAIYEILDKSKSKYSKAEQNDVAEKTAVAAVKYSFLKVSTKQEIAFDLEESVNFNGDSGPYIQYTYARCKSVLRNANTQNYELRQPKAVPLLVEITNYELNAEEKQVLRKLYQFPEIVLQAANNYSPNTLCEYVYDLASLYNTFYNKHTVLGEKKNVKRENDVSHFRLALTSATAEILKQGLYLLGIETLERM